MTETVASAKPLVPHQYGPSRVGHGDAQCIWCAGTNRELAIISPHHCEERAQKDASLQTADVSSVVAAIIQEIAFAVTKFPTWPTRLIDAGNVVSEEAGELAKACLQVTYEPHKETLAGVRKEAIQTAAMCVRFLLSMDRYDCTPGPQHEQGL